MTNPTPINVADVRANMDQWEKFGPLPNALDVIEKLVEALGKAISTIDAMAEELEDNPSLGQHARLLPEIVTATMLVQGCAKPVLALVQRGDVPKEGG